MPRSRKHKRVTYTTLVVEYLRALDDFATAPQIMAAVACPPYAITKTLHHLKGHHVVDVVQAEGVLYWYALPPENDNRSRVIPERAEEGVGSRGPRHGGKAKA